MGKGKGSRRGKLITVHSGSSLVEFENVRLSKLNSWLRTFKIRSAIKLALAFKFNKLSFRIKNVINHTFITKFKHSKKIVERSANYLLLKKLIKIHNKSKHFAIPKLFRKILKNNFKMERKNKFLPSIRRYRKFKRFRRIFRYKRRYRRFWVLRRVYSYFCYKKKNLITSTLKFNFFKNYYKLNKLVINFYKNYGIKIFDKKIFFYKKIINSKKFNKKYHQI